MGALLRLQVNNPLYLYQRFWNKKVAFEYRCLDKHNDLMTQKVQDLIKAPPADYTIATHLLSVTDPATGKPLTVNQLKGEVATFMAAGFETTSHVSRFKFIQIWAKSGFPCGRAGLHFQPLQIAEVINAHIQKVVRLSHIVEVCTGRIMHNS